MANACNLCHLDKSMNWTLKELDRNWQRRLPNSPGWAGAYGGNLDTPVGEAWLQHPSARMRLVAVDAYSRSPLGKPMLPRLLPALNDPSAVNRSFALFALERIGDGLIDPRTEPITAPPAERSKRVQELMAELDRRGTNKP
jgi:hypothetical protein